jgi:hypothetical protein
VHNNPKIAPQAAQQSVALCGQVVQITTQAMAPINFSVVPNNGVFPTTSDLLNAPYLTAQGSYEQLAPSSSVQLIEPDTSFGDLNGDGLDDAAGIVTQAVGNGTVRYALAIFLNQGGIMFNIADRPLGSGVTVYSHHVASGTVVIDMQVAGAPRRISTYQLLGNQIMKD